MDELKRDCLQSKCNHITKLWDIVENGSRSQDLPNKSISNSESVRSTSLKSRVDHDVLYEEFEAFMKPQRDLNNKTKSQGSTLIRGRSWTKMLNHHREISSIWKSHTGNQSWNQRLAIKVRKAKFWGGGGREDGGTMPTFSWYWPNWQVWSVKDLLNGKNSFLVGQIENPERAS